MKHKTLTLTFSALLIASALTTQYALSNPLLTSETIAKQMANLSPYSEDGYAFYSRLSTSALYDQTLQAMQQRRSERTPKELTNLATLLSLSAWDEKDAAEQLELFTQADATFDLALKKLPNNWDAWMEKADLYGHSEDKQTELAAIEILKELTTKYPTASAYKKAKAQELLTKLQQKNK